MEGTIKSYDKACGMGIIAVLNEPDIKFYTNSIIEKSRANLKQGDLVHFELGSIKNLCIAVNIKKCLKRDGTDV